MVLNLFTVKMEKKHLFTSRCVLCHTRYDANADFKNITKTCVHSSQKSIKAILTHLLKVIKEDVVLEDSSCVCSTCYQNLADYDKTMVQLMTQQKELSQLLETTIHIEESSDEDEIDREASMGNTSGDDEASDSSTNLPKSSHQAETIDSKVSSKSRKSCTICGVTRRDEEYLELHMNIHEGKSENECRYCPKRYSRRSHVVRHMHLHWDKKKFQCEKCGIRFSQPEQLYNHRQHHEAEEKPLVCNICGQDFKSRRTFKHHLVTHQKDRPMYPCEICGKKFSEKYTLKVHLKTHQDSDESTIESPKAKVKKKLVKDFHCIICNSIFNAQSDLDIHMTVEHDALTPVNSS